MILETNTLIGVGSGNFLAKCSSYSFCALSCVYTNRLWIRPIWEGCCSESQLASLGTLAFD